MVLPDRGQAEGAVLLGVLLAARAEETQIDQAYRGRQDPFPGQAPGLQMLTDGLAYGRQGAPEVLNPVMLVLVRCRRHRSWYRYCRRPAASVPMAWMWPRGSAQIHTSCQAGGITRALIRASVRGSLTAVASASR